MNCGANDPDGTAGFIRAAGPACAAGICNWAVPSESIDSLPASISGMFGKGSYHLFVFSCLSDTNNAAHDFNFQITEIRA